MRNFRTVLANVAGAALGGWPRNVKAYFELAEAFRPDVVVSDFETWSYLFARTHRLPCISVDNIQIVNRCEHPPEVIAGHEAGLPRREGDREGEAAGLLPLPRHHLLPPAGREAAHHAPPAGAPPGDPRGAPRAGRAPPRLPDLHLEPRAAGDPAPLAGASAASTGCGATSPPTCARGTCSGGRSRSATFVEDLRTARAVVSGGSFTLMSECVHLHKPMLAVPVRGSSSRC